ncbi:GNAT family N-acetyltransferase [Persicimonas caeni]|uniref:GNAT family N-acetyltransferase n=1 Tax=Persicimonas caeni TaxID=2292766 RepID=A0A4Y6PR93_PERCE|nr:GNAT family N-acetyltransferase [Persicimonas caeni]QED31964.1 GNAT family N-acetyltransferase [Persicimonas caeni]
MNPTLRQADVDDARGIARVHVAAWRAAYRGQLPDDLLDNLSVDARTARWKKLLSDPSGGTRAFVAVDDGEVCGFVAFGRSRDADVDTRSVGEVFAIYVHPYAWRHGIGRALLTIATNELEREGFDEATLWVLETNEPAKRFYESQGWEDDGGRKVDERPNATFREMRYRVALD